MAHDQCRSIDGDPWVGQNLAYVARTGSFYNDTAAIEQSIAMWYGENTDTTQADINKLPNDV